MSTLHPITWRDSLELADSYNPHFVRIVAIHEAGHAVAAIVLGLGLKLVRVRPRVRSDGLIQWGLTETPCSDAELENPDSALPHLIQGYSGLAAEMKINPRCTEWNGGFEDRSRAEQIAITATRDTADMGDHLVVTPEELKRKRPRAKALLDSAWVAAVCLVEDHWPAIRKVAAVLEKCQDLNEDEVAGIMKTTRTRAGYNPSLVQTHFPDQSIR
jgi:hypothetical protein